MNAIGAAFVMITGLMTLALPRRLAAIPLLLSAMYMTSGQVLMIGPANFTIPRLLVTFGVLRILMRGEHIADGLHSVDRLLLLWAAVLIGMSMFHTSDAWIYRMGIVWTELGCYFLLRIYWQDLDDVRHSAQIVCIALLPVALLMLIEKTSGQNPFGILGGVNEIALVRDGHIRASGPYAHPILAGTVGAVAVALGLGLWPSARAPAWAGMVAGVGIVYACTSSGPVLMVAFIILGMATWVVRRRLDIVRRLVVAGLLVLTAVMNDPIYFLMARIDISGGSQGYFRAQLISSAIDHLDEWWLAGTDYTRHWMSSGVYANERHTDITNHFLAMGVMGGLLLMSVFVLILVVCFRDIGRALRQHESESIDRQGFVWMLGALLFGFVMNFWSISLFDQSVIFFYLTVAAVESIVRQAQPSNARSTAGGLRTADHFTGHPA